MLVFSTMQYELWVEICCFSEAEWLVDLHSYLWDMLSAFPLPFLWLFQTGVTYYLSAHYQRIYLRLCQRPKGQYPETSALPLSLGGESYVAFGPWSTLRMRGKRVSPVSSDTMQYVNGCLHPWVHPEWEVKYLLAHSSLLFCYPAPVVNRTPAVVQRWEKQVADRQWEEPACGNLCALLSFLSPWPRNTWEKNTVAQPFMMISEALA